MMMGLVDKIREKRRRISILISTLLSGISAGILSASIYDYLTNTSQTLLFGRIPQTLFIMTVSVILLAFFILITIFRLIWIPEKSDKIFSLTLIYNRKEGNIPMLSRSNKFLDHAGYALQELSKEKTEVREILKEDKNIDAFFLELIEYSIVMWMRLSPN